MHGPTFMANPLACAVGRRCDRLLPAAAGAGGVARIERGLADGIERRPGSCRASPTCGCRRYRGVRLEHARSTLEAVTAAAVEQGVWVRPFRDLVYTMPPYVTGDEDLRQIARGVVAAAAAGGGHVSVLFIAGTDTEVGKTVVTAALAALAHARGESVAVVKPVQTGVAPGEPGDLEEVRRLAGIEDLHELARFQPPARPSDSGTTGQRSCPDPLTRWRRWCGACSTATSSWSRGPAACSCTSMLPEARFADLARALRCA